MCSRSEPPARSYGHWVGWPGSGRDSELDALDFIEQVTDTRDWR